MYFVAERIVVVAWTWQTTAKTRETDDFAAFGLRFVHCAHGYDERGKKKEF